MRPYEKYKPSGVEWFGDIPSEWNVKKLKHVLSEKLKYGANESAEFEEEKDPRYIRITDFGENGKLRDDTFKSLPYETAKGYLLKEGDILFARSGATVGKTFQFKNYKGIACYAGYLIKASPDKTQLLSDFLYYFTQSNEYENWKDSIFNKATIQNIGADKYSLLDISVPSLDEQSAISDYLNEKTAQIDKLIANKQKLIELLKEERTAVINGAVSGEGRNWERKKLKHLTKIISKGTTPSTVGSETIKGGTIRFLKAENILPDNVVSGDPQNYISEETNLLLKRSALKESDILIVIAGATIGKVAILESEFLPANTNQAVCFIRLNRPLAAKWVWLCLQANYIKESISLDAVQSAQPNLSMEKIGNFIICVPPEKELSQIIAALVAERMRIDDTISKIEREMELMQEYRTALISEVVTGKVKIE